MNCGTYLSCDTCCGKSISAPRTKIRFSNVLLQIAFLYMRHQFVGAFAPLFLYQLTSVVLLNLPHNEYHLAHGDAYLYVWWTSMVPRFARNIQRLLKYFGDSVVDPQITRNVKLVRRRRSGISLC